MTYIAVEILLFKSFSFILKTKSRLRSASKNIFQGILDNGFFFFLIPFHYKITYLLYLLGCFPCLFYFLR